MIVYLYDNVWCVCVGGDLKVIENITSNLNKYLEYIVFSDLKLKIFVAIRILLKNKEYLNTLFLIINSSNLVYQVKKNYK